MQPLLKSRAQSLQRLSGGQRWLRTLTRCGRQLPKILPFSLFWFGCALAHGEEPTTAFYYGSPVPIAALSHYDRVVVEAENLPSPIELSASGTLVFAYLSVGEAEGWRASTNELASEFFIGENIAWRSRVADLTRPGWAKFLIEQRMAPCGNKDTADFFLIRSTVIKSRLKIQHNERYRNML